MTFVSGSRIYELGSDGVRCLSEIAPSDEAGLWWSPDGTRLVVGSGQVIDADGQARGPGGLLGSIGGWTWPTGKSFLISDGADLFKYGADGSAPQAIPLLKEHGAFAYHPDGLHIAVAGTEAVTFEEFDGEETTTGSFDQTGLFITKNDGSEPQAFIFSDDATIAEVQFSGDGTRVTLIADHGDARHVHSFDLLGNLSEVEGERLLSGFPEDPGLIVPEMESVASLHTLVVDPFDPSTVMVAEGECGNGMGTELVDLEAGGYPIPVAPDLEAAPVGFLGDGRLAILERPSGCDAPGSLWVIDRQTGDRQLVATEVSAASVRSRAPVLNLSLQDVVITGFA